MVNSEQFHVIDTPKTDYVIDTAQHLRHVPRLSLEWKIDEMSVHVKKSRRQVETKTILKNINGVALPGELIVIMGPSGSGKSSMLDILAGRNKNFQGHVKVNGEAWNQVTNRRSCYVMQDDLFYHTLTVEEHLQFQAQLRMGESSTLEQRNVRVQFVLEEFGLLKCKDSYIGNAVVRGISGGERKRLTIATELLTNPSLLFVDEPTSGLDSFMAESVVQQMQKLARDGRTILTTIHQPSSGLFSLFDSLYLLSNGRTVYYGKASDSVDYFASIGYQCPTYMNPTDYFMKQITQLDPEVSKRAQSLIALWEDKEQVLQVSPEEYASVEELAAYDESRLSVFGQYRVLCKRNITRLIRDQLAFRARFFQSIVVSVLVGLIYLQLDLNQTGIQSFTGVLFFFVIFHVFSSANPEFIAIPMELPIISRENNESLYGAATWYLAKNTSELPFQLIFPLVFLIPIYFLIGFGSSNATLFFTFYLFVSLLCSTATGIAYMVSCMVRRADLAPIVGVVILLPLILFGGLFINSNDTTNYFIWLEYISPLKYAYRGIMRAFWTTVTNISCTPAGRSCIRSGDQVLKNMSLDKASIGVDVGALIALNIGFRALGLFFLSINIKKRN
ncbi:hypothetical protein LEN26_016640 [Aphanomyces euteiches]|nr:hypothetical protein LEN26_016640 [Aphanomyces euteiches]KAH9114244.1 hypothetical protein AeMF1_011648 [Aphanomyces euteiches]KAH9187200.1 hypothetical protein AeNC1_010823 [Aphanomyces euteiches]